MICCTMSTVTPPVARTSSNISLPSMPPTAAPTASSVPRRFCDLDPSRRESAACLVAVMARTVQPERKLTVATPMPDTASSTGFIITPPPTPLMPPAVVAARQMRKYSIACSKRHHPIGAISAVIPCILLPPRRVCKVQSGAGALPEWAAAAQAPSVLQTEKIRAAHAANCALRKPY